MFGFWAELVVTEESPAAIGAAGDSFCPDHGATIALMRFPGADFQYFFRWNHEDRYRSQIFRELGIRRFWIKQDSDVYFWNSHKKKLKDAWDEILDLRSFIDPKTAPKSCPDTVNILGKNGTIKVCGVWSVANFDELDLIHKCQKYGTVIINFDMPAALFSRDYAKKYAERMRWLHSAREQFPYTRMIHAGTAIFDAVYCTGLDGTCNIYTTEAIKQSVMRPDGTTHLFIKNSRVRDKNFYDALGEWAWLDSQYPDKPIGWYYYKMLLMVPVYQKEFYSPKNRIIAQDPSNFSERDYYFGYIFRNTRVDITNMKTDADIKRNKDGSVRVTANPANAGAPLVAQKNLAKRFVWNDAIICDTCSLNYCCVLYRKGGACRVPGSQGSDFAAKFASGDASKIMDGMGQLLEKKALVVGQEFDKATEKKEMPDKDTMKLASELFKEAAMLAKLKDPNLTRPKTALQVNVGQPPAIGGNGQMEITAQQFSATVREIEAHGIARENITQELVQEYIATNGEVLMNQPQLGTGLGPHKIADPWQDGSVVDEAPADAQELDSDDTDIDPPKSITEIF